MLVPALFLSKKPMAYHGLPKSGGTAPNTCLG